MPKALEVTFRPGAACWRLYSFAVNVQADLAHQLRRHAVLGCNLGGRLELLDVALQNGV